MTISWSQPSSPAGVITQYQLYQYDARLNFLVATLVATTPSGQQLQERVQNLGPYTQYQFAVRSCNRHSCTPHSSKVSGRTLASAPENQLAPTVDIHNSTAISLAWTDPTRANGPLPVTFKIHRVNALYNTPPAKVVRGVQFSGFGFYRFSGSVVILDSAKNQIELWFKTKFSDGLLLFASSKRQEDLIVIELRDGKPWFIFDTESGPAAFTVQSQAKFNDNQWHHLQVSRDMQMGQISVDSTHKGSGSSSGSTNVIGQIDSIYVGGLPRDYVITRSDSGDASIQRESFIGCVRDIRFKNIPLDFKTHLEKSNVPPLSDHCSLYPQDGIYFKGYGSVVLNKGVFSGGPNFHISFKVVTSLKDALLFYCEGLDAHFIIFISDGMLYLQFKQSSKDALSKFEISNKNQLCDNQQHTLDIKNKARQISVTLDGVAKALAGVQLATDLSLSSETYIGGLPKTVDSLVLKQANLVHHFAGCIRDLSIGSPINLQRSVKSHHNIEFNGCPTNNQQQTCQNPTVVTVYNGLAKKTMSGPLQSFTEYLFGVSSYHENVGGSADSQWIVIRAGDGGKFSFLFNFLQKMWFYCILLNQIFSYFE